MVTKQIITPRPVPKTAVNALLRLNGTEAEIVFHKNKCYLLSSDRALPDKIFDALLNAGWITRPQAIDKEHSHCLITRAGRKKAEAIKNAPGKYTQLPMFNGKPEEKETEELTDCLGSAPPGRTR